MSRPGPTPSQTIGPFFRLGLEWMAVRDLVPARHRGRVVVKGRVLDGDERAVPDAMVELWQAVCVEAPPGWTGFGRCLTDDEGRYQFATAKPVAPADGQAPHLELAVFARGLLQRLVTRIYFSDEFSANASDPLLRGLPPDRRDTLITSGDGDILDFDIHLQGRHETVFLAY